MAGLHHISAQICSQIIFDPLMTSTRPMNSIAETQINSSGHSETMANKAAIRCHSDLGNSATGSRQMTSQFSQDLSSRDSTERCVPSDREHLDPDICNRLWTPFFLTRYTLFTFITFYLSIAAGLVALIIVDRNQQGLASARTSQHYLWTYGPTAILTLAASLWGQVEYRAKQVMPWAVLRTGPTKASETLFIGLLQITQSSASTSDSYSPSVLLNQATNSRIYHSSGAGGTTMGHEECARAFYGSVQLWELELD